MTRNFEKSIKRWYNVAVWWPSCLFGIALVALAAINRKMIIFGSVSCAGKADCVNRMASEVFFDIFNPATLVFFAVLIVVQVITLWKSQEILELVVQAREAWEDLWSR